MPWSRDYRAGTIVKNAVGDVSATTVRGLSTVQIRANSEVRKEQASGSLFADTASLDAVKPVASFTTFDINGAITAFGLAGMCFTSDVSKPGITIFSQKQDCAGIASGSVHDSYQIRQGVIVPRTLNVEHRGNASISYDIYASYDGTNLPVVRNSNVALPAAASSSIGRWTMGEAKIANVALEGKRSIQVDFNATVAQEGADSEQYDRVMSIGSIMPRITINGVDTSWLTAHAALNGKQLTTNNYFALVKRDALLTATVHCKVNFQGLLSWDSIFDGMIASPSQTSMAIDCIWDGSNNPIFANVAAALA